MSELAQGMVKDALDAFVRLDVDLARDVGRRDEDLDLEVLAQALDELSTLDPELAYIVDLRYIAGLTVEETARVTKISPATVKRRWSLARGWLKERMTTSDNDE